MNIFQSPYKEVSNRKYNTWCKYTKRLDTYGCGCEHNCLYCYSKALLTFRNNFNIINPSVSSMTEISSKLRALTKYDTVRLGGMTDCFQPIELKFCNTYNTIILLNYLKISYLIVTKSNMVAEDKYMNIYDEELAHFQISITSTDDNKGLEYEKAPVNSLRIKAVEKLYSNGFDVSIRLSPFLPENIDYKTLNAIKCNKILVEFLKANSWTKKYFKYNYSRHTHNFGGHVNLELEQKIKLLKPINCFEQISVGEYVREHYDYFRDNVNYNKNDCCNLNARHIFKHTQQKLF